MEIHLIHLVLKLIPIYVNMHIHIPLHIISPNRISPPCRLLIFHYFKCVCTKAIQSFIL